MANPYEYRGSGQEFLEDYSPLAAAASAVQSFGEAYERAQDRQQKRMEQNAQMEALKSKAQRENFQNQMDAAKSGFKMGPNGELIPQKLTPAMQAANDFKAQEKGYKVSQRDENGNPIKYDVDPNSIEYLKAKNSGLRGAATMANFGLRQDKASADAAAKVHNDKELTPLKNQARNIDKGLHTLEGSADHKPSWIEVNEVAQDYANALSGAKGSSDFKLKQSEQQSFDKFLGDLAGKIKSDPDQPADQAYVDFYKKFGNRLRQVYDKQISSRAANVLVGAKGAYKHNPDAYSAMKEAADLYRSGKWRDADLSDFDGAPSAGDSAPAPKPQGLVPTGMLKPGMVAPQGHAPAAHPQDGDAVTAALGIIANPKSTPEQRQKAAIVFKLNGLDENGHRLK